MAMLHEVAIYATSSATAGLYDRSRGRAGGAERQMTLLARALAERGRRVAHVIYPPRDPVELSYSVTLVDRDPYAGGLLEARALWRALSRADPAVVVLRTASPLVGVGAVFCKRYRRKLIFSSSNISDFTLEKMSSRTNRMLYGLGLRLADAVVVQSDDQRALALRSFPSLRRVLPIPSFAEATPTAGQGPGPADAFLWFGRAVPQKQPMLYLELARSLPSARFRMIPVPDGADRRLLDEIRTTAQGLPNLELLDPLAHALLPGLIARSVAVVNTSTLEGMPNTFLEAWACGVPVLTLQFDPDAVVARRGLGVAAAGSWERFVAGARELWGSRSDRDEFARRARTHLEEVHSPEAVSASWSALIDELQGGGVPAPVR
jgi:glycosyltransferase involved in cell wall biosynthesis